ncbi:hypothetical protein [Burkholderia lata]|uniref:hypothetical protein n=1 Tax=Burkholderia lata (strain ATCC 17760 / DSM 23089 / LMG 22485 / NCIMB 9086 / R18194 / 383) TaxID=482957 RepID=UPI0015832F90|nr:hypothetical protein [Burkholderia lata]
MIRFELTLKGADRGSGSDRSGLFLPFETQAALQPASLHARTDGRAGIIARHHVTMTGRDRPRDCRWFRHASILGKRIN